MASKVFAVVGILLFVFVCLAMPMVTVSVENNNVLETRCELVDSWLKPQSELLSKQWNETIGVDCNG